MCLCGSIPNHAVDLPVEKIQTASALDFRAHFTVTSSI